MTPGFLLATAGVGLLAGLVTGPRWPRVWLALTVAGAAAALVAALVVLTGGNDWEWRGDFSVGGEPLHLRLDGLSAWFLALLGLIAGLGAVYAAEYWPDRERPDSAPRGRAWWNSLVLGLLAVLVSSNGLHFLIAWEAFTISAYFLITLDGKRPEVRAAGWLYLATSHLGAMSLFAFFALLAARTGGWDLGPMREQAGLAPLFWLALLGFGVKAGLFPLHLWLPSAHANAPSHVSALMSGVVIKMGVYGILRFSGWLPTPAAAGWVILGLGSVTALLGIAFALAQDDMKRLLAYCSVENIGIILVAAGAGLVGRADDDAPWGRLALAGGLLHVWNHGLFKSLLFLGAGSVLHATGTREMSRLGGLWRAMPWTAGLFALGSAAICGLPPLNGFVSEWLIYVGLFDSAAGRGPAAGAALTAAILLAATGALALACFVKLCGVVVLGAPRTQAAAQAHECGPRMRGAMLPLAALCVVIGLAPALIWPVAARAAGAWRAGPAAPPPDSLAPLSALQAALALAAVAGAFALWRRARGLGLRRAPTWDCGYAAPTPRMQYSAGSLAGIAGGWFGWILRPERRWERPRGVFPVGASRIERVPETVLERVVAPAASAIMEVSGAARRLQHGRLHFYILYVVAGLGSLGLLTYFARTP